MRRFAISLERLVASGLLLVALDARVQERAKAPDASVADAGSARAFAPVLCRRRFVHA